MNNMRYATPSPSDKSSDWSSSFSDCGGSDTGRELDLASTSPVPYSPFPTPQQSSVTSAPTIITPSPTSSLTPSGSTIRSQIVKGRRYNEKESDWSWHKERIVSLYIAKRLRLKDVIAIMETEHNFVATGRMYKTRFKEWGVQKNVTVGKVHSLIQKVEQHKKHMHQRGQQGRLSDSGCKTTVVDVGDDLDVMRIQKYMNRKPVGLERLREDPKKPLDIIKALSVDTGKGRLGRPKVSIPVAKLGRQQPQPRSQPQPQPQPQPQFHMLSTPLPPDQMMLWSPDIEVRGGLTNDTTGHLQTVVDQDFNGSYPYICSPIPISPAPSYPWQSPSDSQSHNPLDPSVSPSIHEMLGVDEIMLNFVLKFRVAHVLLDDGLTMQAFEMVNICLNLLSIRLQQTPGMESRAARMVLLFVLTAALEMSISFDHPEMLHTFFQHLNLVFAGQQPRIADIARQLPQLGRMQQVSMLKVARQMTCRAIYKCPGRDDPGYELYAKTVEIANGQSSPEQKLRKLQALSVEPATSEFPLRSLWLNTRVALAVADAPWAAQQQGLWAATSVWEYSQENRITRFLRYASDKLDSFKAGGEWGVAERWATEAAWMAEVALGDDHELTHKFRDAEGVESPLLSQGEGEEMMAAPAALPVEHSLPALDSLNMILPRRQMPGGHKQEMDDSLQQDSDESLSSSPSWEQSQRQFQDTTLSEGSFWIGAGGAMDGGAGLFDDSF